MISKYNDTNKITDVTAEKYTPPEVKIAIKIVNFASARYITITRVGNVCSVGFEGQKSNGNYDIPQGYNAKMGVMPSGYRPVIRAAVMALPTYGGSYNLTYSIEANGQINTSAQSLIGHDVLMSGTGSWITNDPWPEADTVSTTTLSEED